MIIALSGLSVPHFTARVDPIESAIIYLQSIFRNGPNLLSFAIETKIQSARLLLVKITKGEVLTLD
jgi:hypothetical protein